MKMCARPVSPTGWMAWSRKARDDDRKNDTVRCLCGQPGCRDLEVKS